MSEEFKVQPETIESNLTEIPLDESNITSTGGGSVLSGGDFVSSNFVKGSSGWQLDSNGNLEANDGNFRGDITGASGTFSGTLTGGSLNIPDTTTANSFHVDSTGNSWWGAAAIGDATAKVLNTGAGTFTNVAITGGTVGGSTVANVGFVSSATADAVPASLAVSSTGVAVGADGTVTAYVILTWTALSTDTFDHYQVRYKKDTYTYYTYLDSKTNTITIEGLVPNVSYNFGIASVNKFGTSSAFSSDISQTTATNSTAPATVTAGSATAGIQYVILEWTHNTDTDLASYNIYRNTTNDSGSAALIGNCRTNYFVDGGRTGGQIYYYWVKAVNTSGVISTSFSTVKSATPRDVGDADIASTAAIAASKILIDGTVYLSNWRKGTDITKIDGGQISANTITTTQLNFTPVQTGNVIASINASAEGITIDADNLTISAATTFSAGYDPTDKVADVGGTYDSAASGARVRIFPDANTGIQVIDDGAADVFKCLVGGTNVGDVSIGNYGASTGMYYDKSAGTFDFKGSMTAGSININSGAAEILSTGAATFKSIQVGGSTRQYTLTDSGIFSFGDGSDGDVTTSGDLTLTSDMYYQNLTIATGHTVYPNGYRIFVQNTLTLEGTGKIDGDGTAGNTVARWNSAGGPTNLSADSVSMADGYLKGCASTGAGGISSGTPTAGGNGTATTNSIGTSGNNGGAGGTNGESDPQGTPGDGGIGGTATVSNVKLIANWHLATLLDVSLTGSTVKFDNSGSAAGGGGGCRGYVTPYIEYAGGGSGGCSGRIVAIYAKKIIIGASASITANGGNGGNGCDGYYMTCTLGQTCRGGGGGGGGAGGNGGIIILIYNTLTNSGTGNIIVDGGMGGTGGVGGVCTNGGGSCLADGSNGVDGDDGDDGTIYYFNLAL